MSIPPLLNPFRIVLSFSLLVLAAWIILPRLKINLLPHTKSPILTIAFGMPNSSPDIIEHQVTSIIEGACSQLGQLEEINSVSDYNSGNVQLRFNKNADVEYKKFELRTIIRRIYSRLPSGVSYPLVVPHSTSSNVHPLLVYSVNAPLQPFYIKKEVEAVFRKAFAGMPGIEDTKVSGEGDIQLKIVFDNAKCTAWHLDHRQIINSLQSHFRSSYPGNIVKDNGEECFLSLSPPVASIQVIENILIPTASHTIQLKDIARIYLEEQEPNSYFRINGKNMVTLSIYAFEGENRLVLGKKARDLVAKVSRQLPEGFELRQDFDDTIFLDKEIRKNYQRITLSAIILFSFILLAYRSWRHVLNLLFSLLGSLCLTVIFAFLFNVNIHLYTIAGLSVSFGIVTDNAIVMLDYYWHRRNRSIFSALFGANLIIASALCLVFFFPENDKTNLTDFSIIVMLALGASLITTLYFTRGFYELTSSPRFSTTQTRRKERLLRQKVKDLGLYYSAIHFISKYRRSLLLLIFLAFGLPIFMLPIKWKGDKWYNQLYNSSIGAERYQNDIKPVLDKWLGGSLRIFVSNVYEKGGYRNPEETKLQIRAALPFGSTISQMNNVISNLERYLEKIEGIDKYVSRIHSGQRADIQISFKAGFDKSALPYQLKARIIDWVVNWGGVEWNVFGIGEGFSNAGKDEIPNFRVAMKGYNYDELELLAEKLGTKLSKNKRIERVNTNERISYEDGQNQVYMLKLDALKMAMAGVSKVELVEKMDGLAKPMGAIARITLNNQFYPVLLEEINAASYSSYDLLNNNIRIDSNRIVKLGIIGNLELQNTANSIHKQNRQYIRIVGFGYKGPSELGSEYLATVLKEMREEMPVGYTANREEWGSFWGGKSRKFILIAILILIIFIICSALFENLKEPFYIICIIPISFIGLFLTFSLGDFYFDQGGYAAFTMLGSLVSSAAIFIISDFKSLKKKKTLVDQNKLLIKAVCARGRTILLTNISVACGLVPFLFEGQNEVFWFSLAVGTLGGLLFSFIAVFVILPTLLWTK